MLEILEKIFKDFDSPFLPKGFATTMRVDNIYGKPALNIQIGNRDVTILESGKITGTGTNVGDMAEWEIYRCGQKNDK